MKVVSLIIGILCLSLPLSANCSDTQNKIKEYIQLKKVLSDHNIKDERDIASFERDIRLFHRELMAQKRGLEKLLDDRNAMETCYLSY